MKYWTVVTAILHEVPEDWAVYADAFDEFGAPGTVQQDSPPTLSAYYYEPDTAQLEELRQELLRRSAKEVVIGQIEEEDWSETWKQFFKPIRIGSRLVICPVWDEWDALPTDKIIWLDPGQAFGTGDHPTTRMMLALMDESECENKEIADIGCGSGILSVGAMLLGAKSVVGVDVEKQSVESSIENAARNGVQGEFFLGTGYDPLPADAQYDGVVSNIISAALIKLAGQTATRVRPGGFWIVSGIIESNWPDVLEAAKRAGFSLEKRITELEWTAAKFRR